MKYNDSPEKMARDFSSIVPKSKSEIIRRIWEHSTDYAALFAKVELGEILIEIKNKTPKEIHKIINDRYKLLKSSL